MTSKPFNERQATWGEFLSAFDIKIVASRAQSQTAWPVVRRICERTLKTTVVITALYLVETATFTNSDCPLVQDASLECGCDGELSEYFSAYLGSSFLTFALEFLSGNMHMTASRIDRTRNTSSSATRSKPKRKHLHLFLSYAHKSRCKGKDKGHGCVRAVL